MFSKFKNILKIFKRKFSYCLLIIFIGILVKITIFTPCLVYGFPLFSGQIVSENLKGNQMRFNIVGLQIFPNIGSVTTAGVDAVFQKVKLNDKSVSKFVSGFVKFGNVVNTGASAGSAKFIPMLT